jgi:hypothetical protein
VLLSRPVKSPLLDFPVSEQLKGESGFGWHLQVRLAACREDCSPRCARKRSDCGPRAATRNSADDRTESCAAGDLSGGFLSFAT